MQPLNMQRDVNSILRRLIYYLTYYKSYNKLFWEFLRMKELLVVLLVFVVWFLLQAYILPKFGVKT
jgi:hypothetical protein